MHLDQVLSYVGYLSSVSTVLFLLIFSLVSFAENESRAARRAILLLFIFSVLLLISLYFSNAAQLLVYASLGLLTLIALLVILIPFHISSDTIDYIPSTRIDERDIMFSRRLLKPGSARYETYYQAHPEFKQPDDHFRQNPGLLNRGTTFYKPLHFAAAEASFETIAALHPMVENHVESVADSHLSPEELSTFLKTWILKLGGQSVGITALKDYHKYTHVGRGADFGKPVRLEHPWAIALTVEMDKTAMSSAPYAPTVMESAQQYVNSGVIAIQVTAFLRQLGFEARAHIDGNYRVVCPLVARDAGLGEIGRMGLLMTPNLGPRVRLAVITTNAELLQDDVIKNDSVHEFCLRCKKCADVCPSQAISFDNPKTIDGVRRWQINQEKCFTYWTECGTDCGRCVSVCPYSHPDNLMHNLVRKGIKQSSLFQIFALKMDDYFYGRKPAPKKCVNP